MLPDPLHPAVVHLPMALAVLLPLSALVALWAIRRGARPLRAWAAPVALAALLSGSSWLAMETGEAEEDRVEAVVPEAAIHTHEEAAERFLLLAGVVTLVSLTGLAEGTVGSAGRVLGTVGTVLVLVAGVQVGKAGGELVYTHHAGAAYSASPASGIPAEEEVGGRPERDDH